MEKDADFCKSVKLDLRKTVTRDILYSIETGFLFVENSKIYAKGPGGQKIEVQICMDAANIHKGVKQTAIAFSLTNGCQNPNSPHETHEFCLFEVYFIM